MSARPIPGRAVRYAVLGPVTAALLVAGCGGNAKSASSSPAPTRSAVQRLVAYSICMRGNGVPSFPDPNSEGNLVIAPTDNIDPASPQYERAENACKKLNPNGAGGTGMTPAQHAQALAALTRYVECMRKHAIPMASPFSGPNGGVGISLPRTVDPSSEQYKGADAACKHVLPNGG
ncbi:MAG TPA: hypothetical protein VG652_09855 [Gaiellaceae bacterium]|nr:hypothetical protein [Gaiellaceae bacterium]